MAVPPLPVADPVIKSAQLHRVAQAKSFHPDVRGQIGAHATHTAIRAFCQRPSFGIVHNNSNITLRASLEARFLPGGQVLVTGGDLNQQPSGYEPDELPGFSHPASRLTADRSTTQLRWIVCGGSSCPASMGRQPAVSQSRWPKFQGFRHKYKAES